MPLRSTTTTKARQKVTKTGGGQSAKSLRAKLADLATATGQIREGCKQTPTGCRGMDPVSWELDARARYRATQQAETEKAC